MNEYQCTHPPKLPRSPERFVVRTDFSSDEEWQAVQEKIYAPVGEFRASVSFIDDRAYDAAQVLDLVRCASELAHDFLLVADKRTFEDPESSLLVLDLEPPAGRTFRVAPSSVWAVEANLTTGNESFDDFLDQLDPDGVFRKAGDV